MQSIFRTLVALVVSSTNTHGVRSSKRTDPIHAFIAHWMTELNPRITTKVEYKVSTGLGAFDVDVVAFDKDTNKIVCCVLFKATNSSIAKNNKNYEHNKIGEAVKLSVGEAENAAVVFFDIVPILCPTYGKDNVITRMEKHAVDDVRAQTAKFIGVVNRYHTYVHHIFTGFVDYEYLADKKMELKTVVDCEDMNRFKEFVQGLAPPSEMTQ